MREIKFRMWHYGMNRMFTPEEMAKDQMALLPDGHFANIHGASTQLSRIYSHEEMLPLQYTGMEDVSGLEVFEGDVFLNVDTGEHCFVEYFEDGFYTNYPSRFIELTQSVTRFRLSNTIGNLHYVVGNIYENPELIQA